jgi:hypothetical protein
MFKDTCLIAHKRKDRSPCVLGPESLCMPAVEQIHVMHKLKRAKEKQLSIQQGCGNDLNAMRKLLREIWHKNYLIQSYG